MAESNRDAWFWRMWRGEAEPPPVATLLGQRITSVDPEAGSLEAEFVAAPAFLNPAGQVQGGMLAAMLDAATASLVDAGLPANERLATLNLNVSYLRPARSGPIRARVRLQRRGRQVVHVGAELEQDGQVLATAVATCLRLAHAPPAGGPAGAA